jgi:hypothetical protein
MLESTVVNHDSQQHAQDADYILTFGVILQTPKVVPSVLNVSALVPAFQMVDNILSESGIPMTGGF